MQPLHQDRHSVTAMDLKPAKGEPGFFPGAQWGVAAARNWWWNSLAAVVHHIE